MRLRDRPDDIHPLSWLGFIGFEQATAEKLCRTEVVVWLGEVDDEVLGVQVVLVPRVDEDVRERGGRVRDIASALELENLTNQAVDSRSAPLPHVDAGLIRLIVDDQYWESVRITLRTPEPAE